MPVLTGRAFVGGLDPDADIEHTAGGLIDQTLIGRPLDDWTDAELGEYCDHYNIGWVVCWTESTVKRFERYRRWEDETNPPTAPPTAPVDLRDDDAAGQLFTLRRKPTFALHGAAEWQSADANRIVLTDVKPEYGPAHGRVVLSLHYQAGLRVSPSRIKIEPVTDTHDAIPFVRLLLDDEAPVVTITWDRR